ncbi:MAG: DUF362 domain-containing protein [Lachnospiraceae bacterium]|nr:DUF362 domain-containing protein [Lachnospiraceae bacterium]
MNNRVCIIRDTTSNYPGKESYFRPSENYPEYDYNDMAESGTNKVYDMVRQGLKMYGLDLGNYGTSNWNPLGSYIKEDDVVLIKPNLVLDKNRSGLGEECLYTHPSVAAAVIDYVCRALKGTGRIIVGDAPLQDCDFDRLVNDSGYRDLVRYYKDMGISIELRDFRNVKTREESGYYHLQEQEGNDGVVVRLDSDSMFAGLSEEHNDRLRITNYDPQILRKHHTSGVHEYKISQYLLEADVVINLPKPKTHRKAGITGALKNLVGINANKEYLPHHTLGSQSEGGDAYHYENKYYSMANQVLDIRNALMKAEKEEEAREAFLLYQSLKKLGSTRDNENYWEGSWYGNDTIWRTVVDLNKIMFYADKKGIMRNEKQRKYFTVADMIISGEKEGPLEPSPKEVGVLILGEDPLLIDQTISSLMGFDYRKIPQLSNPDAYLGKHQISTTDKPDILSTEMGWDGGDLKSICDNYSLGFQPTLGWEDALGNKYKREFIKKIKGVGSDIIIWGVGINGKYAYEQLIKDNVKIKFFCDNCPPDENQVIIDDIICISPTDIQKNQYIIIAVSDRYVEEIREQIRNMGCKAFGVINRNRWEYES